MVYEICTYQLIDIFLTFYIMVSEFYFGLHLFYLKFYSKTWYEKTKDTNPDSKLSIPQMIS